MNELMTKLFAEQPLVSPGSAKYIYMNGFFKVDDTLKARWCSPIDKRSSPLALHHKVNPLFEDSSIVNQSCDLRSFLK